jgi:hypothetical protein
MVQRFLFDRVDAESARSPVGRQDDLILPSRAYETEPLLSFMQLAVSRTQVALNPPVFKPVPVFRRHHRRWLERCHWVFP